MLPENSTKLTFLLLTTFCLLRITGSPLSNREDDDIDEQLLSYQDLLEKGTPIIEAEPVFQHIQQLIDSQQQSSANIAKKTMKSFMLQMDDKAKQYAQITMHGVQYLVNMGASGTALRAHNEALAVQLWNFIVDLFYQILCFFGIACQKTFSEKDTFSIEDAIFMKIALEQQLREVTTVLNENHILLQEVDFSVRNICPKVLEKLKRDSSKEELYKHQLETRIRELESSIRLPEDKFAEDDVKRIAEEAANKEEKTKFVRGTHEEKEAIIKPVQEVKLIPNASNERS